MSAPTGNTSSTGNAYSAGDSSSADDAFAVGNSSQAETSQATSSTNTTAQELPQYLHPFSDANLRDYVQDVIMSLQALEARLTNLINISRARNDGLARTNARLRRENNMLRRLLEEWGYDEI